MSDIAPIGHNQPPSLADELREAHNDILVERARHELAGMMLPDKVETEEQASQINAWVAKAQDIAGRLAKLHGEVKKPYLDAATTVDTLFLHTSRDMKSKASSVAQRVAAFLAAKRAAEEARRREEAAALRRSQEAAAEAQRLEREAAAKAAQEAEAQRQAVIAAANKAEREAAQAKLAAAIEAQRLSDAAAEQAKKDEVAAAKAADRAEKPKEALERTVAGGASARLKTVTKWRFVEGYGIRDAHASLGPLGAYLPMQQVEAALDRAAQDKDRPTIPGIEFYEVDEAAIRRTR